MKRILRKEKGFTLIELLIVVSILAILAIVIVPNVSKFIGSGNLAAANMEADTIRLAVLAYEADNNGEIPDGDYDADHLGVLSDYVVKSLVGSYTISEAGILKGISGADGGGWSRLEWDSDNGVWVKAAAEDEQ